MYSKEGLLDDFFLAIISKGQLFKPPGVVTNAKVIKVLSDLAKLVFLQ